MERLRTFVKKYKHAWILSYAFIYLPWFLYLEKTVTRDYYVLHTRLDDMIPFNEYFIIPYLLWFAYVAGTILFFFFTNKQDYYRLCAYLFTGMTISLLICTIFPNGTDLRTLVDPDKNFCSKLVFYLHTADTSTNIFPSIHVFNSIGVHIAVMHSESLRKKRRVCSASFILMIAICMATVMLKQHSVVDVAGSLVMAYLLYPFVYSPAYQRQKVARKALG